MADPQARNLRKRPRQQRSRATIERIVDAAARVLSERGYDGASTNVIAHHAGVSPGSFYQYFADKDAVVSAVLQRFVQSLLDIVADPQAPDYHTRKPQFREQVLQLLTVLEEQQALLRVLINEVPRLGPDDARETLNRVVYDGFRLAIARGANSPDDLDARGWVASTIARTLPVRYVLDRPNISQEQFVTVLTAALSSLIEP